MSDQPLLLAEPLLSALGLATRADYRQLDHRLAGFARRLRALCAALERPPER